MQLKRILVSLLVVVLMLSAVVIVSADDMQVTSAAADAAFNVEVVTDPVAEDGLLAVNGGDKINVSITITNNPGVAFFQFDLKYDTTILEPVLGEDGKVAIENGTIYKFGNSAFEFNGITVDTEKGTIRFLSDASNTTPITETGLLAKLAFTVKADAHGDAAIEIVPDVAAGDKFATVPFNTTNVTLSAHNITTEVVAPTCTEEGYTLVKCTVEGCDYSEKIDVVEATGHTEVAFGNGGIKCDVCGEIIKAEEEVTTGSEEITTEEPTEPAPVEDEGSLLWLWILIAALAVAAVVVVVVVVLNKNKKGNANA